MYRCVLVPHHVPTPTRGMTGRATADHPTRTLTLTLIGTLWGDQCLDAEACEGSRLIGSTWMLCSELFFNRLIPQARDALAWKA